MNSSRIFHLLLSVFLIISPDLLALSRSRQFASRLQAVETLQRQQLARRIALQARLRSVRTTQKRHMHPGIIIAEYGTLLESAIAAGKFAVKIGAVLGAIIWEGNREELIAEQKKAAEAEHKKKVSEITIAGKPGKNGTYVLISNRGKVKLPRDGQALLDSAVRIRNRLYNLEEEELVVFHKINLTNNYYAQIAQVRWHGGGKWEAQAQRVEARGIQKMKDLVREELEKRRLSELQAQAAADSVEIVPKPLISEEEIAQIAAAEKKSAAEQNTQNTQRVFKPTDAYNSSSGQEVLDTAVREPLGTLISIDNGDVVRLTQVPNTHEYTGIVLKRAIIPGTTDTVTAALYIQWTNAIKAKQAELKLASAESTIDSDDYAYDPAFANDLKLDDNWTVAQKRQIQRAYEELYKIREIHGNLGDLAINIYTPNSYKHLDDMGKYFLQSFFREYERLKNISAQPAVAIPTVEHLNGIFQATETYAPQHGQRLLDEAIPAGDAFLGTDGEEIIRFKPIAGTNSCSGYIIQQIEGGYEFDKNEAALKLKHDVIARIKIKQHPYGLYRALAVYLGELPQKGQETLDEAYRSSDGRIWGVEDEKLFLFEPGSVYGLGFEEYGGLLVNNPDMLQFAKKHKQTVKEQKKQAREEVKKRNGAGGGGPDKEPDKNKKAPEWEASLIGLSTAERIARIRKKLKEIAQKNGWVKNNKLTTKNNRTIYTNKNGDHYAVDTAHGRFEHLNSRGKHLDEVDIDLNPIPNSRDISGRHDIEV